MTREELYNHDMDYWLRALPQYQIKIIEQLYSQDSGYEEVVNKWLQAFPYDTVPFGTEQNQKVFYNKFLDEIEAFLRGDERYKSESDALLKNSSCIQTIVVSAISSAIGVKLGIAATFIAPAVVVVLGIIGKMGINAWLAKRECERKNLDNKQKI